MVAIKGGGGPCTGSGGPKLWYLVGVKEAMTSSCKPILRQRVCGWAKRQGCMSEEKPLEETGRSDGDGANFRESGRDHRNVRGS